jgi:pimeloyl-ACP methyl ester carboxylesterase
MPTVTSADGTTIAYDQVGTGPVVVLVAGAFNDRSTCAALADALRQRYTVVNVDRRGRGTSTDAIAPQDVAAYTVEHEIADLDAVLAAVGGEAAVFGFSSGAILALRAAAAGSSITKLVMYEPPFAVGDLAGTAREDLPARLAELVAAGRLDDAVATMQLEGIGLPAEFVARARQSPMWPNLVAIAQTVVYDATLTRAPNLPAAVPVETLVLAGSESWPAVRSASATLPDLLAKAHYVEVPGGAGHTIPVAATVEAMDRFLA